jgi:hypothetical protein
MNASAFSPEMFLDMELNEPTERRAPLPIGDYTAVIGDVKARPWQGKADPTKTGIAWDVPLTVDVPAEYQSELGLPATLQFKDSVMLDLTDNGTIDNSKGKNRQLRAYRDALDMNKVGDSFSARKMVGGIVKVKVGHELYQENIVERINGVAKA